MDEQAVEAKQGVEASTRGADSRRRIIANLRRVIHAPDETLEFAVLCLLSEGHLIIEDFPGVGKTTLAKALARSVDCSFSRLQFTPDLLPSDVTGVNVFNQRSNEFEFRPGPVFANILLVDEINRASPKTQAALLECMQERQVTVDGVSYQLAPPFMVMATQNPIEYEGTYPLPEAELDRFTMRIAIGYPPLADEARMLSENAARDAARRSRVRGERPGGARRDRGGAERLRRGEPQPLRRRRPAPHAVGHAASTWARARARASRSCGSPRRGRSSQGRDFVEPDDVKAVAPTVLAHRLILAPEARSAGLDADELVRDIIERTPVPV